MSSTSDLKGASQQADPVIPMVPVSADTEAETRAGTEEAGAGTEELPLGGEPSEGMDEMPPVPDHVREAARQAPDHWLGLIDPTWPGEGTPPAWAVVGQWRSDLDGEIVEWRDNVEYKPSPRALGWADPTDPVDDAVQLAATGYGAAEAVTQALAQAEVAVYVAPGGGLLSALGPDDETVVVPVFTSPDQLHAAGRLSFKPIKVPELLDQLPEGHVIYLNAAGSVSMTVESDVLREAVDAAAEADSEDSWPAGFDPMPSGARGASDRTGGTSTVPTGDLL
ncbi:hypothetical protein M2271_008508 [Streptomyces sp. LBL]|uniref:type VII secretion system-associated protein n=1 Tax=Streptomyces sp. LBL TaxID=2940562 RepID=UPI002474BEDD|nr:type VII secretion system-associated protein [Streptomyces sp. LBL]MDH6630647.1 hypothetical protein [Streptomyces sp. LBL]